MRNEGNFGLKIRNFLYSLYFNGELFGKIEKCLFPPIHFPSKFRHRKATVSHETIQNKTRNIVASASTVCLFWYLTSLTQTISDNYGPEIDQKSVEIS